MGAQNQQSGAQEALQQALAELATVKQKLASVSSDRERLREKSADQAKEIARQAEEIAGQAKEIVGLREQLDSTMRQLELLKRLLFGPKSERYVAEPDPNQYNLFEEPEAEEHRGRDPGFPGPPAQIRTCALTHTAPALGRAVAHDGKSFVRPWVSYPQLRPVLVPQCIHFLPGRFVPLRASPQYA